MCIRDSIVRETALTMGYNDLVRIVEITTHRDAYNNIIKQDVVLGDFTMRDRYRKAIHEATNYVKNVKTTKSPSPRDTERSRMPSSA
ncbi:hypothetical protein JMUB7554_27570 [Staphylococcus aureus]